MNWHNITAWTLIAAMWMYPVVQAYGCDQASPPEPIKIKWVIG